MVSLFVLKGKIRFSKNVEDLKSEIGEIIEKAEITVFTKGVPKGCEGAKVEEWELKENTMEFLIRGTRHLRAHDALLRLVKVLSSELGRKARVGVRGVEADRYEIKLRVKAPIEEVRKVVEGFAEARLEGEEVVIVFEELEERDLRRGVVDRVVREVLKLASKEEVAGRPVPFGYVLKRGEEKPVKFRENPSEVAEKLGWIKRFPARGQWIYLEPAARLLRVIEELILTEILRPMDFREWLFPKLIPFEVMRKMPGYFEELAEGMLYVAHAPRDPTALADFKKKAKIAKVIDSELAKKELEPPEYVMAPAQCEPFYQFFSGEYVVKDFLPIKVFDKSGWTYRWEGGGVAGLTRTTEFLRIECVWIGMPKQVVGIRDEMVDRTFEFCDKTLDLEVRVTVGAPFYMTSDVASKTFIDISKSENIPAKDIEVYLPFRGSREEAEWLELNSINVHRDKYVKSFGIREASGEVIWTGCNGYGLTRYLAAFLATHGFNVEDWPKKVREKYLELKPREIKLLNWPR